MSTEKRKRLIDFCVAATADLQGVDIEDIRVEDFSTLSDEALLKEADWLDNLLNK